MKNDNELQSSAQEHAEHSQMTIGRVPMSTNSTAGDEPSTAEENAAEQLPTNETTAEEAESAPTAASAPEETQPTTAADAQLTETTLPATNDPNAETPTAAKLPPKDNGCLLAVLSGLWWFIKFVFRKWRFTLSLLVLCALAFVGYRIKKVYFDGDGLFAEQKQAIDSTPEEIRALRDIGQWEFLSVDTEELVEKHESSLLSTQKQLVCVYRGTLRIGIDMSNLPVDWCKVQGKTVLLHLPDVGLLDGDFINDTRTTVFVQEGNWNADAKQQLRTQAAEAMKRRALSAENLSLARRNAEEQFRKLFTALGYNDVNIVFGDGKNN